MNDRYAYDRWLEREPDESLYEDVPESEEQQEETMDGRTARQLAARIREEAPHLIIDGVYAGYAQEDWVLHLTCTETGWIYTVRSPEQWDEQVKKESS